MKLNERHQMQTSKNIFTISQNSSHGTASSIELFSQQLSQQAIRLRNQFKKSPN
jgi:hypothetical protein